MPVDAAIPLQYRPPQVPDPTEAYGRVLSIANLAQQRQVQQANLQRVNLENQVTQRQVDQLQATNSAYRDALTVGADGTPDIDTGKLSQSLTKAGFGSAVPSILKGVQDYKKAHADYLETRGKVATQQLDMAGAIGAATKAANYDPNLFLTQMQHAADTGAVDPAQTKYLIGAVQQALQQDPEQARQVVQQAADHMISISPAQQKLINERMTATGAQQRGQAAADANTREAQLFPDRAREVQANATTAEANAAVKTAEASALKSMTDTDWQQRIDDTIPDKNSALYKRTLSAVQFNRQRGSLNAAWQALKDAGDQLGRTETAVSTAKATAPIKINVAAGEAEARAAAGGLTDDDLQRAGQEYGITGVMPSLGRDSVTRAKIEHAKNQWARDNGLAPQDLVQLHAAYSGDKESLKKFQAQRDQIVSFEQTAQKNLDLFLNAAAKIPDSGMPWLNTPLRNLDAKAVGSENMAAVNAARQVANNEIAKVTSGGGLGGVLSDAARHEVENYNPASATFAQTKAVAKVLRQDMANRHASMDAMLQEIRGRMGSAGGGRAASGSPPGGQNDPLGIRHLVGGKR